MAIRLLGVSLAAALVLLPAALPAEPYLVKDLNPALPLDLAETLDLAEFKLSARGIGPEVSYFAASDPAHGVELWRSDGTPGGTERVTDICAGRCSSEPASITVHAGRVFFKANDGFSGTELWVSDGTPGSERRVRDICPGPCSASSSLVEKVGERLLFVSHFPAKPAHFELWQTDGTRDGTVRVKVLCTSGCTVASDLIPIGERALFLVNTRAEPEEVELWVTDGTAAGTRSLRGLITLKASNPVVLPGDGFAWVWASDGLWRTDGTTAGTFRLKRIDELVIDPADGHYLDSEVLWHGLFFGVLGSGEMIRSDGTPEGTFRIAKLPPSGYRSTVQGFAPLDSELLFQVEDSSDRSYVLWSTRGTEDTTSPRLAMGTVESGEIFLARLSGDRAVFMLSYYGPWEEDQLWVTDGTAAGTRQLAAPGGFSLFPTGDGRAFFSTFDLIGGGSLRQVDLWITDGTEAGTHLVRSSRDAPGSSDPGEQATLGGKLVFSALTTSWNRPLFVSDGTAAGTRLLSEDASSADSFLRFGDRLLFSTFNPNGWFEMWATDGTPDGTVLVTSRTGFFHPALFGGQILFGGGETFDGSGTGIELQKTNGRAVELVKDIDRFFVDRFHGVSHLCLPEGSYPVPAGVVGGRLLLTADDGRSGRELWASDGTRAGTVLLRDINPGREPGAPESCYGGDVGPSRHDTGLSSDPQDFVRFGGTALFTADDGRRGRELWITNGTFRGTRRVADLVPGRRGSAPHDLVRFNDRVYFLASNPGQGESLWTTDGTARGTTRVLDLTLNGLPSWGRSLTVAAGRLFFTVYNETTGAELWTSTGEADGTGLIIDLNPGPGSSSAQFLTAVGGTLLFTAEDGLTGLEPWRTDGTAAGTVRLGDIAPGRDASSPGPYTAIPNIVMTGADDGVHGREPWAIPRAEIVQPPQ